MKISLLSNIISALKKKKKSQSSYYFDGKNYAEDCVKQWISAFPELSLKDLNEKLGDAFMEIRDYHDGDFIHGFKDYWSYLRNIKNSKSFEYIKPMTVEDFKSTNNASVFDLLPRG